MKNLVLLLSVFILSCASPQKNFEKGNFGKAYKGALSELEDGKRGKNKSILNRSFNEMLKAHQTEYNLIMRDADIQDWEQAFNKRENLIVDYLKGERWLDDDFNVPMDKITDANNELSDNIGKEYELMGNDAMALYSTNGDKRIAQDAFRFYNKMAEYDPNNSMLNTYINQSLEAATVHILFDADVWDFRYQYDIDRKFKNLENQSDGFIQIYFEENIPHADCMVEIDFNDLDVRVRQESNVQEFTEQIQDGFETVTDTSGRVRKEPIYKDVSGSVTTTTEYKEHYWEVRVKTNSYTNFCDFRSKNFDSLITLERNTYRLSGDERAIPSRFKNQRDEEFRDDEDDVAEDLIDDLYNQIVRYYF